METTFDVRFWKMGEYKGKRATTYYVRWGVAGKPWKEGFALKALAESFRSELVAAARKGEAFYVETGRPISMQRAARQMSWYELACAFVDMKWPRVAATTRRTHAEALTAVTAHLLTTKRGQPDGKLLRKALTRWGFNTAKRNDENMPDDVRAALKWIAKNTRDTAALSNPEILRTVLGGLTVKLDGTPAAPSVVSRRRKIFNTAMEYAVERKLIPSNPIPALRWTPPKTVEVVDHRSVANPVQVRTLFQCVQDQGRIGARIVAFYACLYFAAMRPEEAVSLSKADLSLPREGWGEITIDGAEPHAGKEWTDSGKNRDKRQLKQRARGETRTVPCPPELTAILWRHIEEFGYGPGDRLFVGERNKEELPRGTINRVWRQARAAALISELHTWPLAATPYDLRHAAVSTWLNGGVSPTQVALWAGHSVEVLLKVYAKCLDRGDAISRHRMLIALGHQ